MSNQSDPQVNTVSAEALKQAVKQLPSKQKVLPSISMVSSTEETPANDRTSSCMKTLYMLILTIFIMKSTNFITILKFLDTQNIKTYFKSGYLKVCVQLMYCTTMITQVLHVLIRFTAGWNNLSLKAKKSYIQQLLNDLEQNSAKARLHAGKQLLYIAQGK
jgi:hypothetical protein